MKAASINEIKKELVTLDARMLGDLCMRLAKYKQENKELLTYLLFEAYDESGYIKAVKAEMDELFHSLPSGNVYYIKKSLRKVLRILNKQIKYSGIPQTEIDLRVHFCLKIREKRIPLTEGTVLYNLYQQQLNKINAVLKKLPEDLQADYHRELETIA